MNGAHKENHFNENFNENISLVKEINGNNDRTFN